MESERAASQLSEGSAIVAGVDSRGANSRRQSETVRVRNWRITMVVPLGEDKYRVHYLIDEREKHIATVIDRFGLDRALTEVGTALAQLSPRQRGKYGGS